MATKKKLEETHAALLDRYRDKQEVVKIICNYRDNETSYLGFLLQHSEAFLLLQVVEEFLLNGYCLIPADAYDFIRCNPYDRTTKKILKKEGITDADYGFYGDLDLSGWPGLFRSLKKLGYNVIIQCEDEAIPLFEIGPIRRITKSAVFIQYHDPRGILEKKLTSVPYGKITSVTFGDRYSMIYGKYLKERNG